MPPLWPNLVKNLGDQLTTAENYLNQIYQIMDQIINTNTDNNIVNNKITQAILKAKYQIKSLNRLSKIMDEFEKNIVGLKKSIDSDLPEFKGEFDANCQGSKEELVVYGQSLQDKLRRNFDFFLMLEAASNS